VWRPADTVEATAAWISAVQSKTHPTVIVGSRQTIAYTDRDPEVALDQAIDMLNRGAYVLKDAEGGKPELVILATGSEVPVALKARETLQAEGHGVRVVSVPCLDLLARAPEHERKALLTEAPKIAIEAGTPDLWYRWTAGGPVLGIETFGTSAPAGVLWEKYGITAEALCAKARSVLKPS